MYGKIGSLIWAAGQGAPRALERVKDVFAPAFHNPKGWRDYLSSNIPNWDVRVLLRRSGTFWERANFQALYVACWIFNPMEKGSFMIQLDSADRYANVKSAMDRLMASKELQPRISSHLGGKGCSAHKGWNFLKGYGELLIQLEGEKGGQPYLFLKAEGEPLTGGISGLLHLADWVIKEATGSGSTYSPALNNLAQDSLNVELRAAENFSKCLGALHKQLGLKGKEVLVGDVIEKLCQALGWPPLPDHIKYNTHTLGRCMLGPKGFLFWFHHNREQLVKKGIHYSDHKHKELRELAERMVSTATEHTKQHYHEVRVTADELNGALKVFNDFTTG